MKSTKTKIPSLNWKFIFVTCNLNYNRLLGTILRKYMLLPQNAHWKSNNYAMNFLCGTQYTVICDLVFEVPTMQEWVQLEFTSQKPNVFCP